MMRLLVVVTCLCVVLGETTARGRGRGTGISTHGSFVVSASRASSNRAGNDEELGSINPPSEDAVLNFVWAQKEITCPPGKVCDVLVPNIRYVKKSLVLTGKFRKIRCENNACKKVCAHGQKVADCPHGVMMNGKAGLLEAENIECEGTKACFGLSRIAATKLLSCKEGGCMSVSHMQGEEVVCLGTRGESCSSFGSIEASGNVRCLGRACQHGASLKGENVMCENPTPGDKRGCNHVKHIEASETVTCGTTGHPAHCCNSADYITAQNVECKNPGACKGFKRIEAPKSVTCEGGCGGIAQGHSVIASKSITCSGHYGCQGVKFHRPRSVSCYASCNNVGVSGWDNTPGAVISITVTPAKYYGPPIQNIPAQSAFPTKMRAIRYTFPKARKVEWPPKLSLCPPEADSTWWVCGSGNVKCAPTIEGCPDIYSNTSSARKLRAPESHQADVTIIPDVIEVQPSTFTGTYQGVINGQVITQDNMPVPVYQDFGSGFQGLAAKLTGGLRAITGVITHVDRGALKLLSFPAMFWPNQLTSFLIPVMSTENKVFSAVAHLASDGALTIEATHEITQREFLYSLSNLFFVPQEVQGKIVLELASGFSNAASERPYYHKLRVDKHQGLCVLSGSIQILWSRSTARHGGHALTMFHLDPECTQSYKESFWMAANVKLGKAQQYISSTATGFQLTVIGNSLALWAQTSPEQQTLTVSLDGLVLATTTTKAEAVLLGDSPARTTQPKASPLDEALEPGDTAERVELGEDKGEEIPLPHTYLAGYLRGMQASNKVFQQANGTNAKEQATTASVSDTVDAGAGKKVDINHAGFPTVLGAKNVVVMGTITRTRICALRGVVKFLKMNGEFVAQLNPDRKDKEDGMILCAPLLAQMFFAGYVESETSAITNSVVIQIEPQGRLMVVGGTSDTVNALDSIQIRLDGITYQPNCPPNTIRHGQCESYCFPQNTASITNMSNTGCVKVCAPTQYHRQKDGSQLLAPCRCNMIKHLACFQHVGESKPRCHQYKELISATRPQVLDDKGNVLSQKIWRSGKSENLEDETCNLVCTRQLSSL